MTKKHIFLLIIIIFLFFYFFSWFLSPQNRILDLLNSRDDGIQKVFSRVAIEKKARKLAENGRFDEAIELYKKALEPQYINQKHEKSTAHGGLIDIFKLRNEYEHALEYADKFPQPGPILIEKREIEALIDYRDRGSAEEIEAHIRALREENVDSLPPNGYGLDARILITEILRLYNTIGDHDAGIAFIDEVIAYFYSKYPERDRVNNSAEAYRYVTERGEKTTHRLDWLFYKDLWEYLKIREAFEQDKAEGFQGCAGKKPGEVCMGRATKALIQSDYFPW